MMEVNDHGTFKDAAYVRAELVSLAKQALEVSQKKVG
jgi:hypothetical protein